MRVLAPILSSLVVSAAVVADGPFLFGPPTVVTFPIPHGPTMVAAGDLDGDGDVDLVVPGRNNDGVAFIMLNDNGSFAAPRSLEVGAQCDWVEIVDIDNDGILDLVFALRSNHGRLLIAWGEGDATYEETFLELRLEREPRCVAVADFNGDGMLDLAAANYGSSTIQTFMNTSSRTFAPSIRIPIARELIGANSLQSVRAGDFNGDGLADLAAVTIGSSRVYVLLNQGDGTFEIPEGWQAPRLLGETGGMTSLALGDIDNDGDLDAMVPIIFLGSPSQFGVFRNDGSMHTVSRETFEAAEFGYAFAVAVGDLDGDGDLDAVVGCALPGPIQVLDNRTTKIDGLAFEPPQTIAQDSFIRGVLCVDVDGDCDLDIVAVDLVSNTVSVYWNFTPQENGCGGSPLTGPLEVVRRTGRTVSPAGLQDLDGNGTINGADWALRLAEEGVGR